MCNMNKEYELIVKHSRYYSTSVVLLFLQLSIISTIINIKIFNQLIHVQVRGS